MTRFGMAVDMAHCAGCQTCVVACQMSNALRPGVTWLSVDALEWGRWPEGDRAFLPHACLHCDEPFCVKVCPTGASAKRDDGVVEVAYDRCIGCGVCLTACPYGARTINADDRWFFGAAAPAPYEANDTERIRVAEKCTLCAQRVDEGKQPACVDACPMGVRAFGDLDDPRSDVRAFIEETGAQPVAGTGLFYAVGARQLDVGQTIKERFYRPATEAVNQGGDAAGEGNPAVVVGAGIAAAALAAGAGLTAKKNRDRRAARASSPEE